MNIVRVDLVSNTCNPTVNEVSDNQTVPQHRNQSISLAPSWWVVCRIQRKIFLDCQKHIDMPQHGKDFTHPFETVHGSWHNSSRSIHSTCLEFNRPCRSTNFSKTFPKVSQVLEQILENKRQRRIWVPCHPVIDCGHLPPHECLLSTARFAQPS